MAKKGLLPEVALQESCEACTMAGLILGHFMNGVVDSIEASLFGSHGNTVFLFTGTCFGCGTLLKIGFCVEHALAEEFSETTGMVGFFKTIATEGFSDLRIALAVSLAGHSQIHSYLTALGIELMAEVFYHFFGNTLNLSVTKLMNGGIGGFSFFFEFSKLRSGGFADRATLGGFGSFIDVAADGTDKFFLHSVNSLIG